MSVGSAASFGGQCRFQIESTRRNGLVSRGKTGKNFHQSLIFSAQTNRNGPETPVLIAGHKYPGFPFDRLHSVYRNHGNITLLSGLNASRAKHPCS